MLELRHLRHALALGRFRNYARAAEALHLTQPSLSRSIAALEDELGVRLFDRSTKGVRPTAFGELLLERGAALVAGEADFRREIQLLAGLEAGTLCVGTGPYPAEISIGTAAARLLAKHPRLRIEVLCADPDEIVGRVLAGQYDVGIASQRFVADTPRIRFEALTKHRIVLACRPDHPLARTPRVELEDLRPYPLAASILARTEGTSAVDRSAMGRFDVARDIFKPSVHVNSLAVARRIAMSTDALYPATAGMLADDIAAHRLVALHFDAPYLRTEYGIITLADRSLAPATVEFLAILRDVEAEVVAEEALQTTTAKPVPRSPARRTRAS